MMISCKKQVGVTSNLDTLDTAVPSPASTDVTYASGEMATTSQGQKKGTDGKDKVSSRKQKRSKLVMMGELLDKLKGMQEKSDKMLMELEMKRARLEQKQMEMDIQMRREEREFQLQMMSMLTRNTHGISPPGAPIQCILLVGMVAMIQMPHKMACRNYSSYILN